MDLSELQRRRDIWVAKNFPSEDTDASLSVMGATEEAMGELIPLLLVWESLGRLNHRQLKFQEKIRGSEEEHRAAIADAVADCVIFLAGVCTHHGFDYGEIVREVWEEVEMRDWVGDPEKGAPKHPLPQDEHYSQLPSIAVETTPKPGPRGWEVTSGEVVEYTPGAHDRIADHPYQGKLLDRELGVYVCAVPGCTFSYNEHPS